MVVICVVVVTAGIVKDAAVEGVIDEASSLSCCISGSKLC